MDSLRFLGISLGLMLLTTACDDTVTGPNKPMACTDDSQCLNGQSCNIEDGLCVMNDAGRGGTGGMAGAAGAGGEGGEAGAAGTGGEAGTGGTAGTGGEADGCAPQAGRVVPGTGAKPARRRGWCGRRFQPVVDGRRPPGHDDADGIPDGVLSQRPNADQADADGDRMFAMPTRRFLIIASLDNCSRGGAWYTLTGGTTGSHEALQIIRSKAVWHEGQ